MATLSLKTRTFPYTPTWLGNRESEAPFQLRIKRLTAAELADFRQAGGDLTAKQKASAGELLAVFGDVVEGPIGALEIDGEEVADLSRLFQLAARECPLLNGSLAGELVGAVLAFNELSEEAAGN